MLRVRSPIHHLHILPYIFPHCLYYSNVSQMQGKCDLRLGLEEHGHGLEVYGLGLVSHSSSWSQDRQLWSRTLPWRVWSVSKSTVLVSHSLSRSPDWQLQSWTQSWTAWSWPWPLSLWSWFGPAAWNHLPESIRRTSSQAAFKQQFKTFLFCDAFNNVGWSAMSGF